MNLHIYQKPPPHFLFVVVFRTRDQMMTKYNNKICCFSLDEQEIKLTTEQQDSTETVLPFIEKFYSVY